MTFCAAIKVKDGIVGISDSRITNGIERISAKKITVNERPGEKHAFFIMTSGLRSLRDKAITYYEEVVQEQDQKFNKLYKAVNAYAEQVRRVESEDQPSLFKSGFVFDLFAIVAGQLEDDEEHKVFMLYPQGNWVEINNTSPYFIIGNSGYGKPILERVLNYESSINFALKSAFLSFDATRISSTDVGYPMDVIIQKRDSFRIIQHRFEHEDMRKYSKWWQEHISKKIKVFPEDWIDEVLSKELVYEE